MKIKMLKSQSGSNDGIEVRLYEEGQQYDVGEDLGNVFLKMKVCEIIKEEDIEKKKKMVGEAPGEKKKKMIKEAPENKMMRDFLSNKEDEICEDDI